MTKIKAAASAISPQERFDIAFDSGGLRGLPRKFWCDIIREGGCDFDESDDRARGRGVDIYAFQGGALMVFDRRVVCISTGSLKAADCGGALLERLEDRSLESVLYQKRGRGGALKAPLARIRLRGGARLGPAVVSGDTALFHPGSHRKRIEENRICLQVQLDRVSDFASDARVDLDFVQGLLASLELDAIFTEFSCQGFHRSRSSVVAVAASDREYIFAEFTRQQDGWGATVEIEGFTGPKFEAKLRVLMGRRGVGRSARCEALHADRAAVVALPLKGHWETQPLGAFELKSVFVPAQARKTSHSET